MGARRQDAQVHGLLNMSKLRQGLGSDDAADRLSKALTTWLSTVSPSDLWQTCISCQHLNIDGRMCDKYKVIPPAHVVVGFTVCPGYYDEEQIPF